MMDLRPGTHFQTKAVGEAAQRELLLDPMLPETTTKREGQINAMLLGWVHFDDLELLEVIFSSSFYALFLVLR